MPLVGNLPQVLENCSKLSSYINAVPATKDTNYARRLIERGTCFLPVSDGRGLSFFPSRFIGYIDNTSQKHSYSVIDGRETNKAIGDILKHPPTPNQLYEKAYLYFCEQLYLSPTVTGNFGAQRKYWSVVQEPSVRMPEAGFADLLTDLTIIEDNDVIAPTQREQLILARIGQGKFRRDLEEEWAFCPLSGCSLSQVLRASHIKAWSKSNNRERLDSMNGLLLSANYDALFDRHLISFADDGCILISDEISQEERGVLSIQSSLKIPLSAKRARYMRFHRKKFERRADNLRRN